MTNYLHPDVISVIATNGRPARLAVAVGSVLDQTLCPKELIVVGEREDDFLLVRQFDAAFAQKSINTVFLFNNRTKNLSGAINSVLAHLLDNRIDPINTFIALLDDDDRWEPSYLKKCAACAQSGDLDWVVAGITRHESETDRGLDLSIPNELTVSQFLVKNPHVQGSNMFVRLSVLLKAGGFDENLDSTTDRDVGIRILSLGDVKIGFVCEHLVHHSAFGENRLSTPGSPKKRQGLVAFYQKYNLIMSAKEKEQFLRRASELFQYDAGDLVKVADAI